MPRESDAQQQAGDDRDDAGPERHPDEGVEDAVARLRQGRRVPTHVQVDTVRDLTPRPKMTVGPARASKPGNLISKTPSRGEVSGRSPASFCRWSFSMIM